MQVSLTFRFFFFQFKILNKKLFTFLYLLKSGIEKITEHVEKEYLKIILHLEESEVIVQKHDFTLSILGKEKSKTST